MEQLPAFLAGTLEVQFQPLTDDTERYALISSVLSRFCYATLCRADKGVVLRYLHRITGYSRQQLIRLVTRYRGGAPLAKRYKPPASGSRVSDRFVIRVTIAAQPDEIPG